ncbi:hypothetical protein CSR02_14030 [Acetobacter pomorum]|uniref:Uncharacterized protein n=1 Tax=Acetobacter pomorum TaxID=65959 RepID=A0A2G4R8L6_9PROT|nr:hypothetical protein [Acetobacter pomorum]PHY92923.1 hypothetical protein CSR02_14030 [Acetobacter pomorum]GBR53459.1 hypothetical protein AA11825_2475 [Acetobacter pomorum DSM 11825]
MFDLINIVDECFNVLCDEAINGNFISSMVCADVIFSIVDNKTLPFKDEIDTLPPATAGICRIAERANPHLTAENRHFLDTKISNVREYFAGCLSIFENNQSKRAEKLADQKRQFKPKSLEI